MTTATPGNTEATPPDAHPDPSPETVAPSLLPPLPGPDGRDGSAGRRRWRPSGRLAAAMVFLAVGVIGMVVGRDLSTVVAGHAMSVPGAPVVFSSAPVGQPVAADMPAAPVPAPVLATPLPSPSAPRTVSAPRRLRTQPRRVAPPSSDDRQSSSGQDGTHDDNGSGDGHSNSRDDQNSQNNQDNGDNRDNNNGDGRSSGSGSGSDGNPDEAR